ncbi:MAG: hypothetical protein ACD_3C00064G0001, partial [uncultured bacterium (gcode 4)]
MTDSLRIIGADIYFENNLYYMYKKSYQLDPFIKLKDLLSLKHHLTHIIDNPKEWLTKELISYYQEEDISLKLHWIPIIIWRY